MIELYYIAVPFTAQNVVSVLPFPFLTFLALLVDSQLAVLVASSSVPLFSLISSHSFNSHSLELSIDCSDLCQASSVSYLFLKDI